jgi:hypothetical protein
VNAFVEECRSEWRRLGVPDAVANEMASELDADLRDAEADGLAPEEVLGDGVFDARSFAVAWASERGVVPAPAAPPRRARRTLVAAVIGALALVALFAGIAVLTGRETTQVSIASPRTFFAPRLVKPVPNPNAPGLWFIPVHGKVLAPLKPIPAGLVRSGVDLQPVGWILVALGLAGIASSAFVWRGLPLRA